MEKYGFVYIWYDRKHKRYYIGCRWGREDDGYICSSPWMKQGYKYRPEDFRRKILSRVYTNKIDLLEEEYRWLSKIKKEELGKKYYNLHNHHFGHWSTDEEKRQKVKEKLSRPRPMSEETKQKLRESTYRQFEKADNRRKHSDIMKSLWKQDEFRSRVVGTKTGKKIGPRNGQEYCLGWQKQLGIVERCRVGKGGKHKKVQIDGLIYDSIQKAAEAHNVSSSAISQWIKREKAKLL
jgi:hypothetical protein